MEGLPVIRAQREYETRRGYSQLAAKQNRLSGSCPISTNFYIRLAIMVRYHQVFNRTEIFAERNDYIAGRLRC